MVMLLCAHLPYESGASHRKQFSGMIGRGAELAPSNALKHGNGCSEEPSVEFEELTGEIDCYAYFVDAQTRWIPNSHRSLSPKGDRPYAA